MFLQIHDKQFKPYITGAQIQARVEALGEAIYRDYKEKQPVFLAVLNGSFIFAADLMRAYPGDCEICFVRLASYEGTASTGTVRQVIGLDTRLEGRHVLILEDIIDNGHTLHHCLQTLQQHAPASLAVATLLLKPDAVRYPVQADYTGFEIPPEFVVGYGLDYNCLGRNLRDIYILAT